jgi:hypothetical protein
MARRQAADFDLRIGSHGGRQSGRRGDAPRLPLSLPRGSTELEYFATSPQRRHEFVQNSATIIDHHGEAATPETAAVIHSARAHMAHEGRALLGLACAFRKGSS